MIYAIDFAGSLTDILVEYLLDKFQKNPFDLARLKVILPTRRACQTLRESFLKKSQNSTLLLPQMIALYDMDDITVNLPPAISDWERLFLLTQLCQPRSNLKEIPDAFQVALSLAELLDLSYQYNCDFSNLIDLVPIESFAQHWQETVTFLDIIRTEWPKILNKRGLIDRQDRLQRVLKIKSEEILSSNEYIVMAGLTSDLPAVAKLMRAVYKKGDIFLDGVDQTFISSDIVPNQQHPQYLIYKTIKALDVKPDKIIFKTTARTQEKLVEQAFRSDTFEKTDLSVQSVQNLRYIINETTEQEALTIALLLRQVLEEKDKTASFVTTDRNLARRVITQMKRWQIQLDDSAGIPFKHTPTGSFLLQILTLAQDVQNPTQWLALYKHPLFADGQNPTEVRIKVKNAEKLARQKHQKFNYLPNEKGEIFFNLCRQDQSVETSELLQYHIQLAERWASTDTQSGKDVLWGNPLGKQLNQILIEIQNQCSLLGKISTHQYPNFFASLINVQSAHLPYGYHQRIKILGPIEARLTHTDLCIIGGLNEQIFPPLPDTGPWLNRPMREQLGLPDAEARITSLAHDFMHLAASKEVVLTRAIKTNGTPTVPSRFLQRLQMAAQINNITIPTYQAHLARLADRPEQIQKIERPKPCPKAEIRPKKLSVTNVELLKRNPYAIYAKYILSLYPLDNWDKPAKASLYGQAVHETLSQFLSNPMMDDMSVFEIFHKNLFDTNLPASDCLFYESLFKSAILPFIKEEQKRIVPQRIKTFTEIQGSVNFNVAKKPFTLTARVDRIDVTPHQSATVIDYKTGTPPSFAKVISGIYPQLTLEAWMLLQNGFENIKINSIDDIEYWHLSKNTKRHHFQKSPKADLNEVIQKTQDGLKALLENFANEKTPYEVEPISEFASPYDDYTHLSRKKEWAHEDEGEDND